MPDTTRDPLILNVDDDEPGRYVLTRLLQRAGYSVVEAARGEQALVLASQVAPDLVILDVNLPDLNGLEVARRLRSDPKTAAVPIFHLTATAVDAACIAAGLESGADAYLCEPVEEQVLLAQVRTLLRMRRLHLEVAEARAQAEAHAQQLGVTLEELQVASEELEVTTEELQTAHDELRDREEQFRSVLEGSRDCLYRLNLQTGRYEYVSPASEAIVGYTPTEFASLEAEAALTMVHPDDVPQMRAALVKLERRGEAEAEYRQRAKDGRWRWISNSMRLVRDQEGRPLYRNGSLRDVTERREADAARREREVARREAEAQAAERQRLLEMLDTLPVILTIIRRDYRIEWTNRAYREALGDNVGCPCFGSQFGREDPCEECEAFTPLQTGEPHHWEWTLPNGRTFEIHNFPFTAADGSPAVLEMDIDVTERRAAEAELARHREHLEELVAERTAQLQAEIEERTQAEEQVRRHVRELAETNEDLTRLSRAAVGRELRMIELKQQVNALCLATGQPPRYPLDSEEQET